MSEENINTQIEEEKPEEKKERKPLLSENTVEVLVAIFLGMTALLTAWASWIGSLHGGNQATNYTMSNNLSSEGNSAYIADMQLYFSDLLTWNTVIDYYFDKAVAEMRGEYDEAALIDGKIDNYLIQNGSDLLNEAAGQMTEDMNSPFEVEGVMEAYFLDANQLLEESRAKLEEGKKDNSNGDAYNLVSVIYSVVLFMLGIVGIFRKIPNRAIVLFIAVIGLVLTTVYMLTIPLPTGFDLASFFTAK